MAHVPSCDAKTFYLASFIQNSLYIKQMNILFMLDIVIEARNAAISETMKVKRILPFRLRRMVGPFIFMDHAGPDYRYALQNHLPWMYCHIRISVFPR